MNKLLKYECLLESWYAHINRFFFSLQRTAFIFSVANELRLKMNELFKSNTSPLAPAYVAGYQWSSVSRVSVALTLVPWLFSLVMHLKSTSSLPRLPLSIAIPTMPETSLFIYFTALQSKQASCVILPILFILIYVIMHMVLILAFSCVCSNYTPFP